MAIGKRIYCIYCEFPNRPKKKPAEWLQLRAFIANTCTKGGVVNLNRKENFPKCFKLVLTVRSTVNLTTNPLKFGLKPW